MERWIAYFTSFEPQDTSIPHWGERCIKFEFTDRTLRNGQIELNPRPVFGDQRVNLAELSPRGLVLFAHDRMWRFVADKLENLDLDAGYDLVANPVQPSRGGKHPGGFKG